ncbi:uncharacterized protein BO97DRAFT_404277 [Aspergillus homomorphus CBS 101889]|uniref:GRF-like zinc ribbon domain-containing protein n=1 Tax=Aspergillus homomorphus (strain CBS 101889) TaxID=1450537 RepID=A0A395I2M5_ASPHC|nr:hypothetical protein BO97DRAFT_404277 [Aspergillus homomorphus CBS 101889]RAL14310.1 hypothetical protein BO97DRAFT_404277 [Aspergillus homomorphus CBS 101889]
MQREYPPRLFANEPLCCGFPMSRHQTYGNKNGNVNRPYYKCKDCSDMVFDDWEGIRGGNPDCACNPPRISRGQIERGSDYTFRCARGRCDFKMNIEDWQE